MDIAQILDFLGISNASFLGMLILAGLGIIQALPNDLKPYTWLCHVIKKMLVGDIADKLDKLIADYNAFRNQVKQRQAIEARMRICNCANELSRGENFSKDYFEQILEDINFYKDYVRYCEKNGVVFHNGITNASINMIQNMYQEKLHNNSFLK
jgi:hypothetical protein